MHILNDIANDSLLYFDLLFILVITFMEINPVDKSAKPKLKLSNYLPIN